MSEIPDKSPWLKYSMVVGESEAARVDAVGSAILPGGARTNLKLDDMELQAVVGEVPTDNGRYQAVRTLVAPDVTTVLNFERAGTIVESHICRRLGGFGVMQAESRIFDPAAHILDAIITPDAEDKRLYWTGPQGMYVDNALDSLLGFDAASADGTDPQVQATRQIAELVARQRFGRALTTVEGLAKKPPKFGSSRKSLRDHLRTFFGRDMF